MKTGQIRIQKKSPDKISCKEQFISQFEFFEASIVEVPIKFVDDQKNKYKVEVSKYSSLVKEQIFSNYLIFLHIVYEFQMETDRQIQLLKLRK